ncbi:alpha/beta fold hydrolase [Kaarinaea lacus]
MKNKHSFSASDGVTLSYFSWRSDASVKPVLVLLHGMGSNHTRWQEFIETGSLKQHWHVLTPDLRGHGDSLIRGRITLEIWARDLVEMLDAEHCDQATFVGHSLGAHLALQVAKLYPHKVQSLVLIDPLSPDTLSPTLRWARRLRPLGYAAIFIIRWLNRLGIKRRHLPTRSLYELDQVARQMIRDGKQEQMVKYYTSPWVDLKFNPSANYLQYLYQVVRPLAKFHHNEIPLLLLLSSGSAFKKTDTQHELVEQFSHCTVTTIDCNHWLLTEKPEEARIAIENWLQQQIETQSSAH